MMADDESDDLWDGAWEESDDAGLWDGAWEGKCQACDACGPVDDLSLCDECGPRVERDLIRQRAWDHTALAFARSDDERERARTAVIRQYGAALEILAPKAGRGRRRRKRGRGSADESA
jgi:hypothetical protein